MEIFPIVAGLLCGLLLGTVTAHRRRPCAWAIGSVLIGVGVAATVLSGKWRTSWQYLLTDIPLAGGAAAPAFCHSRLTVRRIRPAGRA